MSGDVKLLGIDIGASGSRARLSVGGQVEAESEAPSASVPAVGIDRAKDALQSLLADVGVQRMTPMDAICVGSAGLSLPGVEDFLRGELAAYAGSAAVLIVNDAMLVLPAAGFDEGIAVVCGTGSVAIGSYGGRTIQIGGWGYLLGDEGGGYWIVREAIRELLRRRDRGVARGDLGSELLAATGASDLAALHRQYYEQPHMPVDWARHAKVVLDSEDPAASDICARAAAAAGALGTDAARQLAAPQGLPVVLAGGLFRNQLFRQAASLALARALPTAEVRILSDAPVAGAVRLAELAAKRARFAGPSFLE